MNTRLQVEHPINGVGDREGVDLVAEMVKIAAGMSASR